MLMEWSNNIEEAPLENTKWLTESQPKEVLWIGGKQYLL